MSDEPKRLTRDELELSATDIEEGRPARVSIAGLYRIVAAMLPAEEDPLREWLASPDYTSMEATFERALFLLRERRVWTPPSCYSRPRGT